ncbi:MAG: histidine kinase dimerization/phospho-acceptor domain-containing protein, partial [Thermodesulfobacteriota bacterium]|nr:histidine kinase dimerization/phospho-acceptor domain-containing protein [Thermodesulfobacteriota bacterium]
TRELFSQHVREHANMVATIIGTTTDHAVQTRTVTEEIISSFLAGHARFLDLLDQLQPFTAAELIDYSQESGLAGVRLLSASAAAVSVPENWVPAEIGLCDSGEGGTRYFSEKSLYVLSWPRLEMGGCVQLAYDMTEVDRMQETIALPQLLQTLSNLDGMTAVRLQPYELGVTSSSPVKNSGLITEMQIPLEYGLLTVTVNGERFLAGSRQLWKKFVGLSFFLAVLGLLSSIILYRYQRATMESTRRLEGQLYRQREEAAIGRVTAAISHEIRNPLNAISIGLQRMQLEGSHLTPKQQRLLASMQQAVERTDGIISGLHRYAKPLHPVKTVFDIGETCRTVIELFSQQALQQNVELTCVDSEPVKVCADRELIFQVLENLVKNGLEAQSSGGAVTLSIQLLSVDTMTLQVINGPVAIPQHQLGQCIEPYFTTKSRGSGLGLPLAKRIMEAHGGKLTLDLLETDHFQVLIQLPVRRVDSSVSVDFSFSERS